MKRAGGGLEDRRGREEERGQEDGGKRAGGGRRAGGGKREEGGTPYSCLSAFAGLLIPVRTPFCCVCVWREGRGGRRE